MGIVWAFFLLLLGSCIGSFLNVLVYRLNHHLSFWGGRSFCPHCRKKIIWHDNFPLFSFILLKGRCRFCHSPISWQYPLVELAAGLSTLLIIYSPLLPITGCWLPVVGYRLLVTYALIAIFVSDLRYQTIPDGVVYPAIGLAFVWSLVTGHWSLVTTGFIAAAFFYLLVLITGGKGMGLGDVKLAGLMGLFLGYPKILVALFSAFLTGAIVGVILILLGKKSFGDHLPFGPFLVGGTLIGWFCGELIYDWYWLQFLNFWIN